MKKKQKKQPTEENNDNEFDTPLVAVLRGSFVDR